jgi:hypothetical protein
VLLGILLLYLLYPAVPAFLFRSALVAWVAYLLTAIGVAMKRRVAYISSFVLASLTLAVSLPVPTHYSFLGTGNLLAGITFVLGSFLQGAVMILVLSYFVVKRQEN